MKPWADPVVKVANYFFMKLFVARLNYDTSEDTLRQACEQFGPVESVKIIMDRDTGRSKGFGFVEMEQMEDGQNCINHMNDSELDGRNIVVKKAEPRG